MNNKQKYVQLKLGNIISLIPEPAAPGQQYGTKHLGVVVVVEGLGVNMIQPSTSNMISA